MSFSHELGITCALLLVLAGCGTVEMGGSSDSGELIRRADYEAAVFRTVSCLRGAGIPVPEDPEFDPITQQFSLVYGPFNDAEAGAAAEQIYEECYAENERDIAVAWAQQERRTPAQESRLIDDLSACMADRGAAPPTDVTTLVELQRFGLGEGFDAYTTCVGSLDGS